MPLYDFACDCGHTFEARVATSDTPGTCPNCERTEGTVRLPSAPTAVVFRGSGFYVTDYKGSRDQ